MARVVVFDEIGGPEVMKVVDLPVTAPGADEVRIRVQAIGVNRADQMMRSGVYAYLPRLPRARLGVEAAGVIDALGSSVTQLAVGDEVLVTAVPQMDLDGVYGDYVNLPAATVIRRPGHLSAVDAAAMWIVFATAYGSLVDKAGMRAGDYVLITAASSAVGLAAIQTANQAGAIPIAVTRHEDKKDALVKAGARHVIVADAGDVASAARDLTGGAGVDIILDSVAGPGLAGLSNALKDHGTIVVLGWLDTRPALLPMHWPLTVIGYVNYEHTLNPDMVRRIAAFLDAGIAAGTLSPTVARVFDLDHIVDAHRYLETGNRLGKVIVTT